MKFSNNSPISCEMPFYPYSHHLEQLYTGFELLKEQGIVVISYNDKFQHYNQFNIIKVRINNAIDVVYDLSDGIDWLIGKDLNSNMTYFNEHLRADFYFKRSYNKEFADRISHVVKVFPYGFNYGIISKTILKHRIINTIKKSIDYPFFHKYFDFNMSAIHVHEFEKLPFRHSVDKILFLARLWDPHSIVEKIESQEIQEERERINLMRISCINACKTEFRDMFIGGVQDNDFSRRYCKDLIQPRYITNRKNYLQVVKESNICIATTGLHGSIGWKMGEYIAASRAIISEPLNFQVTGEFSKDKNYLEFVDPDDLISKIRFLISNPQDTKAMMFENFKYYNAYLRPDILILNTLQQIEDN